MVKDSNRDGLSINENLFTEARCQIFCGSEGVKPNSTSLCGVAFLTR